MYNVEFTTIYCICQEKKGYSAFYLSMVSRFITVLDFKGSGYRMGVRFVDISLSSPLLLLAKRVRNLGEWRDKYDNQIDPKFARAN